MLDQSASAWYDQGTMYRTIHPGWGTKTQSLQNLTITERVERLQTRFDDALTDLPVKRARSFYRDEHLEMAVLTMTGTVARSTLERASVDSVLALLNGIKLQQHTGTTKGSMLLDSLQNHFEELASRGREVVDTDQTALDASETGDVILGPIASGSLFHQLSHYLEMDSVYIGSSALDIDDRIGPSTLSIEDTIHPGSWAARPFDAEGRPTQPVMLVADGLVKNYLYNTSAAIEENTVPAGNAIPSLGFDDPPRIHARHLDVAAGDTTDSELYEGADLYVKEVGKPWIQNEATRTKRASTMPPTVLYAKDIGERTPSDFETESTEQEIHFPIREGYRLQEGKRTSLLTGGSVVFQISDLRNINIHNANRKTSTGVCRKHKSTIPFAVTAPAIRFPTTIRDV